MIMVGKSAVKGMPVALQRGAGINVGGCAELAGDVSEADTFVGKFAVNLAN